MNPDEEFKQPLDESMVNSNITSSVKKAEKLTLKPFDIKKGGGPKVTSKPVLDNGMKGYLNPYGGGTEEDINESYNGGGNYERN
jgi:hypothetical protein